MKAYLDWDELYPYYIVSIDPSDSYDLKIELSEEDFKFIVYAMVNFGIAQNMLEQARNKAEEEL